MSEFESIGNNNLITILESLELMAGISVAFPPLEANRFYRTSSELFEVVANEAISRGLNDYAEFGLNLEGIHAGTKIGEGSELEELIDWHKRDAFLDILSKVLAELGAQKYVSDFANLNEIDKSKVCFHFEYRIRQILDREGCKSFLDLTQLSSMNATKDEDAI